MRLALSLARESVSLWRDAVPMVGLGLVVCGARLIDCALRDD